MERESEIETLTHSHTSQIEPNKQNNKHHLFNYYKNEPKTK